MIIGGLVPTHEDKNNPMISYAQHDGKWYFVAPFSFDGHTYDWVESSGLEDLNEILRPITARRNRGSKCKICHKGTMKEMSIYDDMDGMLTCDKCGVRVKT